MDQNVSPIKSASVSLGNTFPQSVSPIQKGKPWVVLIYGDFGFNSNKTAQVNVSEWYEFISKTGAMLLGTVKDHLPSEMEPFYVEFPITSVKDFSKENLYQNVKPLNAIRKAIDTFSDMSKGTIDCAGALQRIENLVLTKNIKDRLVSLLKANLPISNRSIQASAPSSSRIDSILSLLETDADESVAPVNGLFDAAAKGETIAISKAVLESQIGNLTALLDNSVQALMKQSFFTYAYGSWQNLYTTAKIIGRNNNVHLFMYSVRKENVSLELEDAIKGCADKSAIPDVVLLDIPFFMTPADMDLMSAIASVADRTKCMVLCSLDSHDGAFAKMTNTESARDLFKEPDFIAYKRMRNSESVRCVTFCAPDAYIGLEKNARVGAANLLALQWIQNIIEASSPFSFSDNAILQLELSLTAKFDEEFAKACETFGFTLLRLNHGYLSTGSVKTLLDTADADPSYALFAFNLLVNRTIRLAAFHLSEIKSSVANEQIAQTLRQYLLAQLKPYHILSTDNDLSVEREGAQQVTITIDSGTTLETIPVRFQFTLGI